MTQTYTNIPEKERSVDGLAYYRALADRAKQTNWGLKEAERAILNLAVRTVQAEESLKDAIDGLREESKAQTELEAAKNEIKGLKLTIGRMKKRAEEL